MAEFPEHHYDESHRRVELPPQTTVPQKDDVRLCPDCKHVAMVRLDVFLFRTHILTMDDFHDKLHARDDAQRTFGKSETYACFVCELRVAERNVGLRMYRLETTDRRPEWWMNEGKPA